MILEFILKGRRPPQRFRLPITAGEVGQTLYLDQQAVPVAYDLVERILLTSEDEAADDPQNLAPSQVRTWRAVRWELQLFPSRRWVLQLAEITTLPGRIVGGRAARYPN